MTTISSYRQHNQMDRIHDGRQSGALTRAEAKELRAQQAEIRAARREAGSDGVVTASERKDLRGMQNEASRDIYQAKHDNQTRQNNTPRVDNRLDRQSDRIGEGVKSGELTRGEAKALREQQGDIRAARKEARSDGVVTKEERGDLRKMQNEASRDIYQAKHDNDTRRDLGQRVDNRQDRQLDRIGEGIKSGELTPGEARRLSAQQARVARAEARAEKDGVVTEREQERLERKQDRASAHIYRLKHDRV